MPKHGYRLPEQKYITHVIAGINQTSNIVAIRRPHRSQTLSFYRVCIFAMRVMKVQPNLYEPALRTGLLRVKLFFETACGRIA